MAVTVKFLLTKELIVKITNLSDIEKSETLTALNIITNSENPFKYAYNTVSSKIGDMLFKCCKYYIAARVTKNQVTLLDLVN